MIRLRTRAGVRRLPRHHSLMIVGDPRIGERCRGTRLMRDAGCGLTMAGMSALRSQTRILSVVALGTALVLAIFSSFVVSVRPSVRAVHGGPRGATWALSGMSLGLAAALLT